MGRHTETHRLLKDTVICNSRRFYQSEDFEFCFQSSFWKERDQPRNPKATSSAQVPGTKAIYLHSVYHTCLWHRHVLPQDWGAKTETREMYSACQKWRQSEETSCIGLLKQWTLRRREFPKNIKLGEGKGANHSLFILESNSRNSLVPQTWKLNVPTELTWEDRCKSSGYFFIAIRSWEDRRPNRTDL